MTRHITLLSTVSLLAANSLLAQAQPQGPEEHAPPSLRSVSVPSIEGLSDIVKDQTAAIVLGKALFWDQALGSDGIACASCHYHAGADVRVKNEVGMPVDLPPSFDSTHTGGGGTNYSWRGEDFPFYKLSDPNDRKSSLIHHFKGVGGSAGAFKSGFAGVPQQSQVIDNFYPVADPLWNTDNELNSTATSTLNTRQVTGRNAPTTINAAFQYRSYWDGRANNEFNGIDNWGPRNPNAYVWEWDGTHLTQQRLRLKNAALASQAVAPPNSDVEMSCHGRDWLDLAQKILPRQPLAYQYVASDDSVLGPHVDAGGVGLNTTYTDLVMNAFYDKYWSAPAIATVGCTQMEHNFTMFFGLSVMLYEQTLISDQTAYDDHAEQIPYSLTEKEKKGLEIFLGKGKCVNCHKGPDFTGAGYVLQKEDEENGLVERMRMQKKFDAQYDNGFYNIAVDPTSFDIGVGRVDPFGNPYSWTRQWLDHLNGGPTPIDDFTVDPLTFEAPLPSGSTGASDRDAVDGAFKTPTLRNVELTGPYMHNGSMATLEQVVEFYNRGGNHTSVGGNHQHDTTGFGPNPSNLDADIEQLHLTSSEQKELVAFMKALTDPRVKNEMAPFDHPSLVLPEGHNEPGWFYDLGPIYSTDNIKVLPAVGAQGRQPLGLGQLRPFHKHIR